MRTGRGGLSADAVLSVPTGGRDLKDNDQDRGLAYVSDALDEGLDRIKYFVLCVDADAKGLGLREALAIRLGKVRLWFVDWPEGCKDANDMLLSDGPEALRELVTDGALEWPVRGVYRLSQLPEVAAVATWKPGFPEWATASNSHPGCYLSSPAFPVMASRNFPLSFGFKSSGVLKILVASFETAPKPHMRRQLRTLYSEVPDGHMSDAQRHQADRWIDDHYLFALDGIGGDLEAPTFDWLLEKAEYAVVRYGVKVVQVDPWNRLESGQKPGETMTAYIGLCLRTLHNFARQMGVDVQIIGHPAKQLRADRRDPPDLDDMSDSQHWRNMPDQGFVIHRPKIFEDGQRQTEAVLYQKKARFEELGYECKLGLDYRLSQGRYVSTDYSGHGGLNRVSGL